MLPAGVVGASAACGLVLLLFLWLFLFCIGQLLECLGLVCEAWGAPFGGSLLEWRFGGSIGVSCTIFSLSLLAFIYIVCHSKKMDDTKRNPK